MDSAKRIMSGTWGEVWLDGDYVGECYKCQAKWSVNKDEVSLAGQMAVDTKAKSIKGTGSIGLHKVSSRMATKIGEAIQSGKDLRFTLISKLDDPDANGAERIAYYNVSFDDLTLADWEVAVIGKVECPFTFTKSKLLDAAEDR